MGGFRATTSRSKSGTGAVLKQSDHAKVWVNMRFSDKKGSVSGRVLTRRLAHEPGERGWFNYDAEAGKNLGMGEYFDGGKCFDRLD